METLITSVLSHPIGREMPGPQPRVVLPPSPVRYGTTQYEIPISRVGGNWMATYRIHPAITIMEMLLLFGNRLNLVDSNYGWIPVNYPLLLRLGKMFPEMEIQQPKEDPLPWLPTPKMDYP